MTTKDPGGTPETGTKQGDPSDPKSGQGTPSCDPNVSDTDLKTCASVLNVEELYLTEKACKTKGTHFNIGLTILVIGTI